jgi:hypothetical protein
MMSKKIELATSRRKLAVLWGIAFAVFTVFLIAQTAADVFGSHANRAWGWFLPTILPTLTLIFGTIAYQVQHPTPRQRVDGFAYSCALWASGFYLLLVAATLLLQRASSSLTSLEWLERSNLYLGPVQGLTALAVSVFFQTADAKGGQNGQVDG